LIDEQIALLFCFYYRTDDCALSDGFDPLIRAVDVEEIVYRICKSDTLRDPTSGSVYSFISLEYVRRSWW
jgi:hypothetical protein